MCLTSTSLTFRSPSSSQTGSPRTACRSLRRSCAVKGCIFLQSVGVSSLCLVPWILFLSVLMSLCLLFYLAIFLVCVFLFKGIKSADRNELAQISSQPSRDFIFFVGDFKLLNTLLPLVSPQVCSKAGGVYASDGLWAQLPYTPKQSLL